MDPILRISLIVLLVTAIKAVLYHKWNRLKAHQASQPIPMRFVDGAYRPWGLVEKVRHYGWRLTQLWLLYVLALLGMLGYSYAIGGKLF